MPKNVLNKKPRKNESAGGWVGLGFSKCTGGSVDFFAPSCSLVCVFFSS
jgi:hypothetical protein